MRRSTISLQKTGFPRSFYKVLGRFNEDFYRINLQALMPELIAIFDDPLTFSITENENVINYDNKRDYIYTTDTINKLIKIN